MHDQYLTEICRQSKHAYEKQHCALRKRQKKALDMILDTTKILLDWPNDKLIVKQALWQGIGEQAFRESLDDLQHFQQLEERGYSDFLLARYPSLRILCGLSVPAFCG